METYITGALAQLGAVGLLIGYLFWTIRTKNKQCDDERMRYDAALKVERDRNQSLTEKVIALAEAAGRSGSEQANAARELTTALRTVRP